jgi:hypothetical protein
MRKELNLYGDLVIFAVIPHIHQPKYFVGFHVGLENKRVLKQNFLVSFISLHPRHSRRLIISCLCLILTKTTTSFGSSTK